MPLRICTYNIEWFNEAFTSDNTLHITPKAQKKLDAVSRVLKKLDADVVGVVEAADTSMSSDKDTVKCLEAFAHHFDLRITKAITGFVSRGQQELAIMYDPQRIEASWVKGGTPGDRSNPPFDGEIFIDTNEDRIVEVYTHFRPPLEVELKQADQRDPAKFRILLVHAKSKGMFARYDMVHYEREAERNRRKLFGECLHVRRRLNEWIEQGHEFVVMGDINDGPGMDSYEARFGRSAVEMILGDLFDSSRSLCHHGDVPRWTRDGWVPWTTSYKNEFTHDKIQAMIDHIFTSRGISPAGRTTFWNTDHPDLRADPSLKDAFEDASDHFPVTLDIDWP